MPSFGEPFALRLKVEMWSLGPQYDPEYDDIPTSHLAFHTSQMRM
uniref:UBC core domain-containing protein n=1 Tax=Bursaphelenchus xylophilus TaxID=6326 RepID=A0A1I7SP19_BURXY